MQQPEQQDLPYGGDIQEAIRNQDRGAVKTLLAARNQGDTEESKEVVNADALHDALLDRKSVAEGTSVSVRVDLGGRRILNNKRNEVECRRYKQTKKEKTKNII